MKNVTVLNVNAKLHTSSLAATAFWLDVKMVDNVRQELNVFQLLAVLATVLARKDIEHSPMVVALMWTNALKIHTSVALELVSFRTSL